MLFNDNCRGVNDPGRDGRHLQRDSGGYFHSEETQSHHAGRPVVQVERNLGCRHVADVEMANVAAIS